VPGASRADVKRGHKRFRVAVVGSYVPFVAGVRYALYVGCELDWLLIVEAIKALVWPVVVLVLGWRALPVIKGLAERINSITAGGNQIQLNEVPRPKQLEAPKPEPGSAAQPEPQLDPEPAAAAEPDLLEHAPAGAVINAWARLVEVMRREADRLELTKSGDGTIPALRLQELLGEADILDDNTMLVVSELRTIRNKVVHDSAKVSAEAAQQYVETVQSLVKEIEHSADILKIARIFGSLRVSAGSDEEIRQVVVGPLRAVGRGSTVETARQMAIRRRGMWAAAANGVTLAVTERDAALLIAYGAQRGDPEQRAKGKA